MPLSLAARSFIVSGSLSDSDDLSVSKKLRFTMGDWSLIAESMRLLLLPLFDSEPCLCKF